MNGCHDDDWLISRFRFPKAISSWKSVLSERYNNIHARTRSVVERAIGQLKSRWRCLDRSGGMLLSPCKGVPHCAGMGFCTILRTGTACHYAAVNSKNIKKLSFKTGGRGTDLTHSLLSGEAATTATLIYTS
ncbi:hypothetical protein N1851_033660 [Merluccius polli]|uniref:DDE Tnp4 domain-containing protein n=1 Tax=Merluccius polli TaxID=89951 RepID=A0AA47M117_MERPO|nr:hypothetical protein N1851_033660 [Merluccius polli]